MGLRIFSDSPPARSPGFSDQKFSDTSAIASYGTVGGHENLRVVPPFRDGNPNKYRYDILKTQTIGQVVVVEIHYLDCFSWSGRKICVYDNAQKFQDLHQKDCIDPHFLENNYSPVARFEPTQRGWQMAIKLANALNSNLGR